MKRPLNHKWPGSGGGTGVLSAVATIDQPLKK